MFLRNLKVQNWKCYKNSKQWNWDQHNIINSKNGTGKSSMFQAILYALTGKVPVGFNMNTVRYDENKAAQVCIEFDMGGHQYYVERNFGGNNSVKVEVDGTVVAESVRNVDAFLNDLLDGEILRLLWTDDLVNNSNIFSVKFFTETLLDDVLRDANAVSIHYTQRIRSANKQINSYQPNTSLNIEMIKKEMDSIKEELREGQRRSNDREVSAALVAKQAFERMEQLEGADKGMENVDIPKFKRLLPQKERLEKKLKQELEKRESVYSKFSLKELEKIANESARNGKCVLCGGSFTEGHLKTLLEEMDHTGRSEQTINELKADLAVIEGCTKERVDRYEQWLSAKQMVERVPNWKSILEAFDQKTDQLWDRLNQLQKDLSAAERDLEEGRKVEALRKDVEGFEKKKATVEVWLEDARNGYTRKVMSKAGQYLNGMNGRYKSVDIYEGTFVVVVEDENFALNLLPVARLSGGEKTMCALSLLLGIHSIFLPEMPLLFDETFAALDDENLSQVQSFLRKLDTQIFVITHDQRWVEI